MSLVTESRDGGVGRIGREAVGVGGVPTRRGARLVSACPAARTGRSAKTMALPAMPFEGEFAALERRAAGVHHDQRRDDVRSRLADRLLERHVGRRRRGGRQLVLLHLLRRSRLPLGIRWFDGESQNIGRPYWMTFDMDARVFGFFAIVCIATGILFGLAPALHISKTNVNEIMKEGGRSGSGGLRARRWTAALIVAELTLTLVLLAGAGFMMRSFVNLYQLEVGIDTSRMLTMGFILPTRKYTTMQSRIDFMRRMEERLNANAAIAGASTASNQPLGGGANRQLEIDGKPLPDGEKPRTALMLAVGARYFDAVGVSLLRGRTFDAERGHPGPRGGRDQSAPRHQILRKRGPRRPADPAR